MKLKLEKIEELIVSLKSYATTTIDIIKLEAAQHTSNLLANLISRLIVILVIILFAFFLSLGISVYLSELLDNSYLGFGIVAGVYLLLGIILIAGRKKLLIKPISDIIIHEIFQNQVNKD
jgi:ABC-type multidrug transport system permease subunit